MGHWKRVVIPPLFVAGIFDESCAHVGQAAEHGMMGAVALFPRGMVDFSNVAPPRMEIKVRIPG